MFCRRRDRKVRGLCHARQMNLPRAIYRKAERAVKITAAQVGGKEERRSSRTQFRHEAIATPEQAALVDISRNRKVRRVSAPSQIRFVAAIYGYVEGNFLAAPAKVRGVKQARPIRTDFDHKGVEIRRASSGPGKVQRGRIARNVSIAVTICCNAEGYIGVGAAEIRRIGQDGVDD